MFGHYMAPLAWKLSREGYEVSIHDYPTRRFSILEHGEGFACHLERVALETADSGAKIDIVTHSLGGILARVALSLIAAEAKLDPSERAHPGISPGRIGRIVMLAPPNKGSTTARLISNAIPWAGSFAKPLPELSEAPDAAIHSIPVPEGFDIGIIAGTLDIHVSARQAELATARSRKTLVTDHTFMPFYPHVFRETLHYLKSGSFL